MPLKKEGFQQKNKWIHITKGNGMNPISEIELNEITRNFKNFKIDGCSELKAAYLATSNAGFTEIKMAKNKSAMFHRQIDDTFLIVYAEKNIVMVPKEIDTISFTTKTEVLERERK